MIKSLAIVALVGVAFANPTKLEPDFRIMGGAKTSIETAPYQVVIFRNNNFACGGSIIDDNWVLTAAHCVRDRRDAYTIRAGSTKKGSGGSMHTVVRIISHEKYAVESGASRNDIALFEVKPPFQMDSTRQAIELFESGEETEVGISAEVTGWGSISYPLLMSSEVLKKVSVPIISKAQCKKAYAHITKFYPGQICAGYSEGGNNICDGDSGGPLVINDRLAGIVAWAAGCAYPGNPGVFTEVAYFRDWIDGAMKKRGSVSTPSG